MAEAFLEEQLRRIRAMSEQMSRVRALYDVNQERQPPFGHEKVIIDRNCRRAPALVARIVSSTRSIASAAAVRVRCAFVAVVLLAAGCAHGPAARFDARAASPSCRQVLPLDSPTPAWIEPTNSDTRVRLSHWCDTVGPVFFNPHAAGSATPIVDSLAIVSWNIHEGSGDPDDLIRRLRAGEFTSANRSISSFCCCRKRPGRARSAPAGSPRIPDAATDWCGRRFVGARRPPFCRRRIRGALRAVDAQWRERGRRRGSR